MNQPTRNCNCSGSCVPQSSATLNRREFIGLVGAGAAGAVLTNRAWGEFTLPQDKWEQWQSTLFAPSQPRVYHSGTHGDARMHLGGIGTGNFEIGADGQFTTWQLFNTLRDGHVPFYFGVKAGDASRLLQTTGGPDVPRIERIEMSGEYPFARLKFRDSHLPVHLELDAFTPFAPLDSALSSLPVACFLFRLSNPTDQPQQVSLAAFLQNAIGYDAAGAVQNDRHPNFGGNINEPFQHENARGVLLRASAAAIGSIPPMRLFISANLRGLQAPPADHPKGLQIQSMESLLSSKPAVAANERTVIWIESAPADLPEPVLRAARDAVNSGATLLFAGKTIPLLDSYGKATGGKPLQNVEARPDILFADFERGYDNWEIEGRAFGPGPAKGTLPHQQRVSGFLGKGLVNTYFEGDATTGKLRSTPFKVDRHYLRLLVGGGSHAGTQVRLTINGKVVRSVSGTDNERLQPASWDVREFEGQTARLEIVDEVTGPWGHINVDHIELSDRPANQAVFALLQELLPVQFASLRPISRPEPGNPNNFELEQAEPAPDAVSRSLASGLNLRTRPVGRGQVILAHGSLLDPDQAGLFGARRKALATVCEIAGVRYESPAGVPAQAPGFGSMALAALAGECTVLASTADLQQAWNAFVKAGKFNEFAGVQPTPSTPPGQTTNSVLVSTVTVTAQGTVEIPFLLAWHYPNKYNAGGTWMGCHYATRWADARAIVAEAASQLASWRARTESFRKTFYDSTLPWWLLDCVTANAAIIRHIGVVFRIANGDIYGWEGSNGCCQPTCTHVWGYEQTLARLFPDLEREMRRIDFKHQQREDGGVNNRTDVPSPPRPTGEQPFADGHASCILKAYREALNSPDDRFLKEYWPHVKRAVNYLIGRDAKSHSGEPAGVLEDDQWNTYDQTLHGVTTFISGYYLAALRAGEEWARRMGDAASAQQFHAVFEKGRSRLIELCWNGEYFQQWLPEGASRESEVGPGCMADQLIGQWWAHQLGLGYILPKEKVIASLQAIFKYNFKSDLTGWRHAPRAFAGANDKGLLIVTWPKGGRPNRVMLYSDEVWTGIEYQVAAHMIYEGLLTEGFAIVKAARDRYDGVPRTPIQRNPWNEIECGGHYARALSSWSLLLALSGFEYAEAVLRFSPRHHPEQFKSFFCAPVSWGAIAQRIEPGRQTATVHVQTGELPITRLELTLGQAAAQARNARVSLAGRAVPSRLRVSDRTAVIELSERQVIQTGGILEVVLSEG